MKQQKEIISRAKERGWVVLRTGSHRQTIIVHEPTGARMSLWLTAKAKPTQSIMAKMANLERSGASARKRKTVNWLCAQFGIGPDDGRVISFILSEKARAYATHLHGAKATKQDVSNAQDDIRSSDRVWLMEPGKRGQSSGTARLVCGENYILSHAEQQIVESLHQVNGVIDEPKRNGLVTVKDETEPLVPLAEPAPVDEFPMWPAPKTVQTEPVEVISSVQTPPASFGGLPDELVAALRAHLKVDTSETVAGLEMVTEAVTAAYAALETVQTALGEIEAALALVKVPE